MMEDADYALALKLQQQFDQEADHTPTTPKSQIKSAPSSNVSIIDKAWEVYDPTPNIFALFQQFNKEYFDGKLDRVEVKWSPRMTQCAGVCSYEGRGGLCSVRLSKPLLTLRPRSDLVETMLHEMIHAYLFVADGNREREEHGPNFVYHMNRINKLAGTNITIYHSFHNEVAHYRQHWWRCNGPCRTQRPFFGMVKRAMNRKPGPYDIWWKNHESSCGGTFIKVREPDGFGQKKEKNIGKKRPASGNIMNFFPKIQKDTLDAPHEICKKKPRLVDDNLLDSPVRTEVTNSSSSAATSKKPVKKEPAHTEKPVRPILQKPSGSSTAVPSSSNSVATLLNNFVKKEPVHTAKPVGPTLKKPSEKTAVPNRGSSTVVVNSTCQSRQKSVQATESTSIVPFSGQGYRLGSGTATGKTNTSSRESRVANTAKPRSNAEQLETVLLDSDDEDDGRVACPVCYQLVEPAAINEHLDTCLQ